MAKKRKKKTSVGVKLISIILIGFSIAMLSGVLKDIYDVFSLQKQAALVEKQLQELKEENASLVSTKEKLEDPEYVQTYARGEYMFSRGDEKIFYLPSSEE